MFYCHCALKASLFWVTECFVHQLACFSCLQAVTPKNIIFQLIPTLCISFTNWLGTILPFIHSGTSPNKNPQPPIKLHPAFGSQVKSSMQWKIYACPVQRLRYLCFRPFSPNSGNAIELHLCFIIQIVLKSYSG